MDCRVKPGNDSGGLERNQQVCEMTAGAISLFPVDINNENCNFNVLGRRGRYATPYVIHDVSPSVVIRVVIPVVIPICHHLSS